MPLPRDPRPARPHVISRRMASDASVAAAYGVVLMLVSGAVFAAGAERRATG
jgi:hypothetical protein